MRATFNRKSLLEAFAMVSGVVPTRSPKPILQNIKLIVETGADGVTATLVGTDLEVGVRRRVEGVKVDEDGDVILPTARFGSILKSSVDAEVGIETTDEKIVVKVGRSKFSLALEDPNLYPEVPQFDSESYAVLVDSDLKTLIRNTSYACDVDASARFALGGVLVERGENLLTFVATDGRRLSKATAPADYIGDGEWANQPIIPLKALKLIAASLDGDGGQAHLAVRTGTAIMVRTDDATVYSRLLEGRFPAYDRVFPDSPAFKVPLKVADLRTAVDQAAILTSEESRGVEFAFGFDELRLTTNAADVGQADVRLPYGAPIDGLDLNLTMDPKYILDALRAMDQESSLDVELVDAGSAVVLRSGENCVNVIMPIQRQ